MTAFISERIEEAAKISTEKGKEKYQAYFVKTKRYKRWKEEVDRKLIIEGYQNVTISLSD